MIEEDKREDSGLTYRELLQIIRIIDESSSSEEVHLTLGQLKLTVVWRREGTIPERE